MIELIIILSVAIVLIIFCVSIDVLIRYKKESTYIKMEMARSASHRELAHWKREMKRLKKRTFPFLYLFDRDKK